MPTRRRPTSRTSSQRRPATRKGLSAKTFKGMNPKRMKQKSAGTLGLRLQLNQGETKPIQPLQKPSQAVEFDQHQWKEGGTWYYVPCLGDDCPLCEDEDETKAKLHYKCIMNVYDLRAKKVQVLEGPKTLATQIFYRYQRKPETFLKRVFDLTKFPTQPVTYGFELAEERPVKVAGLKLIDLDEYIQKEVDRYFGEDGASTSTKKGKKSRGKSALDDDDEDEEFEDEEDFVDEDDFEDEDDEESDEEEPSEDEMLDKDAWSWPDLKEYGREVGLKKDYTKRSVLVAAIIKRRGY